MTDYDARASLLSETTILDKGRWPSPTTDLESAAAFLRSKRPGPDREDERKNLLVAFYPLPPNNLSKARLRAGLRSLHKAWEFVRILGGTQVANRFRYLKALQDGILWAENATLQLLQEPASKVKDRRRKIDGWGDHLRETLNVFVAAQARGYELPSTRELMALAILQETESLTGADRSKEASLQISGRGRGHALCATSEPTKANSSKRTKRGSVESPWRFSKRWPASRGRLCCKQPNDKLSWMRC
jgi:hypothetical protein